MSLPAAAEWCRAQHKDAGLAIIKNKQEQDAVTDWKSDTNSKYRQEICEGGGGCVEIIFDFY